jgi:hypothetical protein
MRLVGGDEVKFGDVLNLERSKTRRCDGAAGRLMLGLGSGNACPIESAFSLYR